MDTRLPTRGGSQAWAQLRKIIGTRNDQAWLRSKAYEEAGLDMSVVSADTKGKLGPKEKGTLNLGWSTIGRVHCIPLT